jgi:hypothetical protein
MNVPDQSYVRKDLSVDVVLSTIDFLSASMAPYSSRFHHASAMRRTSPSRLYRASETFLSRQHQTSKLHLDYPLI